MLLLNDYEQEITSMLVASKRDMQQTILSQLSKKMFTNRLFAKVFEVDYRELLEEELDN